MHNILFQVYRIVSNQKEDSISIQLGPEHPDILSGLVRVQCLQMIPADEKSAFFKQGLGRCIFCTALYMLGIFNCFYCRMLTFFFNQNQRF